MKNFTKYIFALLFIVGQAFTTQAQVLFFSEYAEGSSNNKYFEVYNPTSDTVDLSNYAYPNSNNTPSTPGVYDYWNDFDAGAVVLPNDVYVVAHGSADASILAEADETHNYLSNGDDGYGLVYGDQTSYVVIDWLGNWDGDPGAGWDVAGITAATKDHTLVRKCTVTGGNTDWTTSAGTDSLNSEWLVYPKNTWTYLGVHENPCNSNYTLTMTDSWGDGWNGNEWTATSADGTVFGPYTIASGSTGTATFTSNELCFAVVCGGGSFQGEVSWSLDSAGTTILTGGAPYTGTFGDASCYGCIDALAGNYDATASFDDGSCTYPPCTAPAPTNETFSTGLLPVGVCSPNQWEISATTGDGWRFTGTPGYNASANGRTSGEYAWIDFSGTDVDPSLEVEDVDVSSLTTPTLRFDYFSDLGTYTCAGNNKMHVEAFNGTTWNSIAILDLNVSGWNTYSYSLVGFDNSGTAQVRFRAESSGLSCDYYQDLLLDDVKILDPVLGCMDPILCGYNPLADTDDGSCGDPAYTLTMNDSYGDGWNGNTFDVVDSSGTVISSSTLSTGSTGTETLCLPDACYDIIVGGGSYSSEISWSLVDAVGTVIVSGANTYTGNHCIPVIFGCTSPSLCGYNPLATNDDGSCGDPAYTLTMIDSYGDGWNGNDFVVTDASGVVVSTSTLSSGALATDILCLADDASCYTVTCGGGSYMGEVSWTLANSDGVTILSGGAPYNDVLCLPVVVGCMDLSACNYDALATIDDGSCSNTYTLTMIDSYGDGWNGCNFTIAGSSYTFTSGSSATATVCLTDICYPVTCSGGWYESEVSWTLANSAGVTILSGGAPYSDTLCLPVVTGCTDALSIDYNPLAGADDGSCTYPCIEADSTSSFETGLEMWTQDSGDNFDWTSKVGPTGSSNTGPSAAYDGSTYMYTETSPSSTWGASARLVIPCVDMDAYANPGFSFAYHMYGATMGTLNVDISSDNGTTWTNLWTTSGDLGDVWNQAVIDLGAYSGQIDLRIEGVGGTSFTSDMAIDLTSVYNLPAGCTDPLADNYDALAFLDDGSCEYSGCMETGASNYDPTATIDDGSCLYSATFNVDMSCEDPSTYTTVHLESPFFGCFTGCTQMLDPDGDLMFSVTVGVPLGNLTYLYSIDNNSSQENLVDDMVNGGTCAPITDYFSYANREMVVVDGSNSASGVYGSCDPCIPGCTDSTANNYDPLVGFDNGSCEWDVTFSVDMNCAGFTPTTLAATGPADAWSGDTYLLSDADGDGVWTGTHSVTDNFIYMYAADSWGSSEFTGLLNSMLNGGTCAPETDGLSYAYRVTGSPSTTSDTYASCDVCLGGCTDPAASNYDPNTVLDDGSCVYATTFNVDMNCEPAGSFGYVHLESPLFGWCGGCVPMTDADGDGVHSVTIDLALGDFEYKYAVDSWGGQEDLVDDMQNGATCAPLTDYWSYANRLVDVMAGTITDDTYGSCDDCDMINGCTDAGAINYDAFATDDDGSCLFSTTFNVDMNCESAGSFGYVHLESPAFGWCGGCVPLTDADGDGVHSVTVDLPAGDFEYKYAVDGFAGQENLIDDMQNGASCAPVTDYWSYANRLVDVNGISIVGGENVQNGDFSSGGNYWALSGGWAVINGAADLWWVYDGTAGYPVMYQNNVFVSGQNYRLTFDANVIAGSCDVWVNNEVLLSVNTTQSYSLDFVAGDDRLWFVGSDSVLDLTIDNVSVVEIEYGNTPNTNDTYGSCSECTLGCMDTLAFNYSDSALVDDGSCLYGYNCPAPYPIGLSSSDVFAEMATVNWGDANDGASCRVWKYFVRYRPVGDTVWTTKSAGVGSGLCNVGLPNTSKVLRGLAPSTTYEYKMKAFYCGGGESGYSYTDQFTTLGACPPMDNLAVETFTANHSRARFSWTDTGPYVFARIALRVDVSGSTWQTAGGFGVYYPTMMVNKYGLTGGTTYRAQGRTFCDANVTSYRSTWTSPVFWTQPGVAPIRLEGGSAIANFDVYPNPSKDIFNISFVSENIQNLEVKVLNMIGAVVYTEGLESFVGEYTKQINLSSYTKGVYFLEITTNTGVVNKKIVLQ